MNNTIKTLQIKKETISYDVRTKKDNTSQYARVKFIDINNNNYAMNVNYPLNDNLIKQLETGKLPITNEIFYSNQYGKWTEVKIPYDLNPFSSTKKYLFKNEENIY